MDFPPKSTVAGIYALRRLQVKRCGRLGPRAVLALDCCLLSRVLALSRYERKFQTNLTSSM